MLFLPVLLSIPSAVWAAAIPDAHVNHLVPRSSLPGNFSTYAPIRVQCPQRQQWVRPADDGISPEEAEWVKVRKQNVLKALSSYLSRLHLEDFDLDAYLDRIKCEPERIPTIGMAISGGGWLSALTGTSGLLALDDRFGPSVQQRTGGILQAMTYLSGLSGGSWPAMSLATYNNPTIEDMVSYWHTDLESIASKNNTAHRATADTMFKQIVPKAEEGYQMGIMEFLGRTFGYEFAAGPNGGLGTTLSGVSKLSAFKNGEMPFTFWQAAMGTTDDIEFYGYKVPFFNATEIEWNPFEFGAWGTSEWFGPGSFFPTEYVGTKMADGKPVGDCVVNFDEVSFVLGSAADAANFWLIEGFSNNTLGSFSKRDGQETGLSKRSVTGASLADEIQALQQEFKKYFGEAFNVSAFTTLPNPFATKSSLTNSDKPPANLTLLDNSEEGQAIPLWGQVQPARNPEFVLAWDADGDAIPYQWSNGTNLYNAYIYATQRDVPFPIVPKPATFINRNYTLRPTFFGCDANLTSTNDTRAPIIMYLPNAPYSSYSNFTWFQTQYSNEQMATILTNGFNMMTQGNSTLDAEWPECMGCAAIDRSISKLGMQRTEQCQRCMQKYCWDGVSDDKNPGIVDPTLALAPSVTFAKWNASTTADFWAEYE